MDDKESLEFHRKLRFLKREFINRTKACFITGCNNKTIKAHSVSDSRILKKIALNGYVMYVDTPSKEKTAFEITQVGKKKATTFPGFCDQHDKIFETLDNDDFVIGNQRQEFLFAFRAAAREYTVRIAMQKLLEEIVESMKRDKPLIQLNQEGLEFLKKSLIPYTVGTGDIKTQRAILNKNLTRGRYWKLQSTVIKLDKEYPIVASSTFKLERGPSGKLINDLVNLKARPRPIFFTVFPQNDKTYCLLTWHKNDNPYYDELRQIDKQEMEYKKTVISNVLTSYVENFAVNPAYWQALPPETMKTFENYFGATITMGYLPFIIDPNYSLFLD